MTLSLLHILIKNILYLLEQLVPSNFVFKTPKLPDMSMSLHTIQPHPTTETDLILDFCVHFNPFVTQRF